jgi:hypothetical protein
VQYFDENYFLCRLVSRGLNTELIRVQAQLKDGMSDGIQVVRVWMRFDANGLSRILMISDRLRMWSLRTINRASTMWVRCILTLTQYLCAD